MRRGDGTWPIELRPLTAADLPVLHEWLGREHVCRWWGEPGPSARTVEHYLPAIEGHEPTDLFAVVLAGRDVGLAQTYLVADYPDYAALVGLDDGVAGLDLFVADAQLTGRGLGTAVIRRLVADVVFARPETIACIADPDVRNSASIRAFEKAGFTHVREVLDPEDGELHALMKLERAVYP